MSFVIASLAYLVAAVCFILALRGLSSPETARGGNRFGIAGMVLAVLTTLLVLPEIGGLSLTLIGAGIAIGGAIGYVIARRIQMTAPPPSPRRRATASACRATSMWAR
jgi:NAD(P) transhydrogenase subunit beta